ncbi:ATP-dependent helicase HrpB [Brachybacterium hainanense]|uniref:ATP-dependent helicase HrpB n=1 Tax=Brachybacterium hainanense TaxID=1541174 RepID=A0ABV6R7W9_9MICO
MHRFDLTAIGAGLPVAGAMQELTDAAAAGAMVVLAPPGTGKTTVLPPLIANIVAGRTLVTQPRRVAVRSAARRVADLDGSDLGGPVGFTVRGQRQASAETRLEMLTPGVLLRRLLADPLLDGVDAVVLDEVHERSLDQDLLLGMLAQVREVREDLLVVAMSATLDAGAVAELLGAQVVEIPSPLHALTIEHAPAPAGRLDERGVRRDFLDHLARITADARSRQDTDALVFLPGAHEVDELVRRLRPLAPEVEVLPLHGRLPAAAQDRATAGRRPGEAPRIVVSTALAESSLTVPGVRLVVDAGLSREVRRDRGRDMAGLVTVSASRESIVQRAGRAARQGPGTAIRAFSETDEARMPARALPQIAVADLTDAALTMAAWGTPGGDGLPLWDAPPPASVAQALRTLRHLELTGEDDRPTPLGLRVARMPVGVREARALLEGVRELGDARAAAEVVAAVSDDHRAQGADLESLLRDLRSGRSPGADRWRRESDRLTRLAELPGARPTGAGPGTVLALARPERIARRVAEGSRSYLLASGTRAALPEGSGLAGQEWLAVWEVQRAQGRSADGTGAVIRLAAPLGEEEAQLLAGPLLTATRTVELDASGRVLAREVRVLGAITLSSTPVAPRPEDIGPAILQQLRTQGLSLLTWSDAALALRARLALLHGALGAPWPAVDDEALLAALPQWLGPDLTAQRARPRLAAIDVASALRRLLPWPEASRLDTLAPERLPLPGGRSARIAYTTDAEQRPVVAVKLQDLLGADISPRIVDGRIPVLFHLLSPARRPLAITEDLASFWAGPYQQVRKEMRGRYPKHAWPEDPLAG